MTSGAVSGFLLLVTLLHACEPQRGRFRRGLGRGGACGGEGLVEGRGLCLRGGVWGYLPPGASLPAPLVVAPEGHLASFLPGLEDLVCPWAVHLHGHGPGG